MNTSIRIIVADDHHLVRKGIVMLLSSLEGLEVVREGGNGEKQSPKAQNVKCSLDFTNGK